MFRIWVLALLWCLPLMAAAGEGACGVESPEVAGAFDHLYNFNFPAAHADIDRYIAAHPREPLGYAVRAAAYLFYELDRLRILESEFLISDKHIAEKKTPRPDPNVRTKFLQALDDAESRADAVLASNPNDRQALFAMSIVEG
ncbi:MAG TPA: hypothetical protein VKR61_03850, partial [Bryobacteraceae bacterium]|nr:hypothetical protein [Bryobacteraceae bacterium]